jgi:hypothetical protein
LNSRYEEIKNEARHRHRLSELLSTPADTTPGMSPHLISLQQAINSNVTSDEVRKQVVLIKTECENVLRR